MHYGRAKAPVFRWTVAQDCGRQTIRGKVRPRRVMARRYRLALERKGRLPRPQTRPIMQFPLSHGEPPARDKSRGSASAAYRLVSRAHRSLWASAMRRRPASVRGPVEQPPWFAHRPPFPLPLRMQGFPLRVFAPQRGDPLSLRMSQNYP